MKVFISLRKEKKNKQNISLEQLPNIFFILLFFFFAFFVDWFIFLKIKAIDIFQEFISTSIEI